VNPDRDVHRIHHPVRSGTGTAPAQ
jgi:hypothetical protein